MTPAEQARAKEICESKIYYGPEAKDNAVEARTLLPKAIAEIERLRKMIQEFQEGVQNFKCPACHSLAGPFYSVNLMDTINCLEKENANLRASLSRVYGRIK